MFLNTTTFGTTNELMINLEEISAIGNADGTASNIWLKGVEEPFKINMLYNDLVKFLENSFQNFNYQS